MAAVTHSATQSECGPCASMNATACRVGGQAASTSMAWQARQPHCHSAQALWRRCLRSVRAQWQSDPQSQNILHMHAPILHVCARRRQAVWTRGRGYAGEAARMPLSTLPRRWPELGSVAASRAAPPCCTRRRPRSTRCCRPARPPAPWVARCLVQQAAARRRQPLRTEQGGAHGHTPGQKRCIYGSTVHAVQDNLNPAHDGVGLRSRIPLKLVIPTFNETQRVCRV